MALPSSSRYTSLTIAGSSSTASALAFKSGFTDSQDGNLHPPLIRFDPDDVSPDPLRSTLKAADRDRRNAGSHSIRLPIRPTTPIEDEVEASRPNPNDAGPWTGSRDSKIDREDERNEDEAAAEQGHGFTVAQSGHNKRSLCRRHAGHTPCSACCQDGCFRQRHPSSSTSVHHK